MEARGGNAKNVRVLSEIMLSLEKKYLKEVVPKFKEKYGLKNDLMVPKIEKVVITVGLNRTLSEKNSDYLKWLSESLMKITGQKPVTTLAKKSISEFKIREGTPVGLKVTLRKKRMNDFLFKLINVALPRDRDFRGLPLNSLDKQGNLSLGFKEQAIFPEINAAEAPCLHGLEVTIKVKTKDREKAKYLFELLGFPFKPSPF